MNIEKGKIIKLEDDNEYYVIDKMYIENKCYLYISRLMPMIGKDLSFVEYINGKIYPISNDFMIKKLLLMVNKNNL